MKLKDMSFAEINPQNTLLYLFCNKKGNWEEIRKALAEKEELPDSTTVSSTLDKWKAEMLAKDPEMQVLTILNVTTKEYPVWLTKLRRPPFVIVYTGSFELLNPKNKLLVVENGDITKMLRRYGIAHGYAEPDSITLYANTAEAGDTVNKIYETGESASERLISIGDRFLAIDGQPGFLEKLKALKKDTDKKKLYALPGNAGCMCNKLIKSGWHLCDCGEDLISIPKSK